MTGLAHLRQAVLLQMHSSLATQPTLRPLMVLLVCLLLAWVLAALEPLRPMQQPLLMLALPLCVAPSPHTHRLAQQQQLQSDRQHQPHLQQHQLQPHQLQQQQLVRVPSAPLMASLAKGL